MRRSQSWTGSGNSETGGRAMGGEPLMRDDLCTIARYGTDRGLRMVMGTSGLHDRSMAARPKEAGIRQRLSALTQPTRPCMTCFGA